MRTTRLAAGSIVLVLLAGCVVKPEPLACDASSASFAIGLTATAALVDQARLSANAATVRVLRPGEIVTLEFNPTRLNIEVDANARVLDVRCG